MLSLLERAIVFKIKGSTLLVQVNASYKETRLSCYACHVISSIDKLLAKDTEEQIPRSRSVSDHLAERLDTKLSECNARWKEISGRA